MAQNERLEDMSVGKLDKLTIPFSGQKFLGQDFRDLRKPGVYVFMLKGLPLYIGCSSMILRRIGGKHDQAERAISECDEVYLFPCVDFIAAQSLEILLIGKMRPKYNKQLKMHAHRMLGIKRLQASKA